MVLTPRPELDPLPPRLQSLPLDARGYPVPWFVAWTEEGQPEFRAMDGAKWRKAIRERRCWVCGQPLGVHLAFVIGPMCGVNRTTSEPPCHLECAIWSAKNCPFLSRPHMVRRPGGAVDGLEEHSPGFPILRNPGVTLVWITRSFTLRDDGKGKALITVGEPERTLWFTEHRTASREEVIAAVAAGLPALLDVARQEDQMFPSHHAEAELRKYLQVFEQYYPFPEQ